MRNTIISILVLFAASLMGCKSYISIDKRPNIAFPIVDQQTNTTNDWVIVDQGYVVNYQKWGFNTEIQSMSAELTTNKTIKFTLGGYSSNVITNSVHIRVDDLLSAMKMFREICDDNINTTTNQTLRIE